MNDRPQPLPKRKGATMKEGFAIGAGLIIAGLMLELSTGPIDWDAFAYPANVVALAVLVIAIVAMHLLRRKVYVFRFMGTLQAAIPAMCYAVVLTTIMGLTRQTVSTPSQPLRMGGINNMLTFWPFVLIYTYMAVILGLVVIQQFRTWAATNFSLFTSSPTKGRLPVAFHASLLFHLGLFIVLTTATLGSADMQRLKMITSIDEPEWRAIDQQGNIRELPLAIELKRFIMEQYDDGSPRRFASDIQILTKSGKNILCTVDVNKPVTVDGWKVYQYGYDTQLGAMSRISILELVTDPWLPFVYVGIYLMLAGAVCMFLFGGQIKLRGS